MTKTPNAKSIIAKKRDGGALDKGEIEAFVHGAVNGQVPDYQVTAWLMAVYFQGMTAEETAEFTRTMIGTGEFLPRVSEHPLPVDKHSTGGVGDKISFLVAPLVAAAGGIVPMISGRSLGHTGGTLDKLETIPGLRTNLSTAEFMSCVRQTGLCISGQSDQMVPADRLFYSLRDAASIVESIPLITASILSKKVAEGAGALVLDVKYGRGAFMPDRERARTLALSLTRTSALLGQRVRAYLTDMDRVLGRTAGNAIEIVESVRSLREGPDATSPDLRELTLALGAGMLELSGASVDDRSARRALTEAWTSGAGLQKLRSMVEWLGGDVATIDDLSRLPSSSHQLLVESPVEGVFAGLAARDVGDWITESGGGRLRTSDVIDPGIGVEVLVDVGEAIGRGEPALRLHLTSKPEDAAAMTARAARWIEVADRPRGPWVTETIDPEV
ncbi:MAG: thymidine phosphorylase [Candidatus Eisenbacteria bacterium]